MPKSEQIQPKAESLQELELKANLNPEQREYLDVLKHKMKKILSNKTKQELAKAGDLVSLKNYRAVLLEILEFLQTKEIKTSVYKPKELWNWEVDEKEVVDLAQLEKKYGRDFFQGPIFASDGENYFIQVRQGDEWVLLDSRNQVKEKEPGMFKSEGIMVSLENLAVATFKVKRNFGSWWETNIKLNGVEWNKSINIRWKDEVQKIPKFCSDGSKLAVINNILDPVTNEVIRQEIVENDQTVRKTKSHEMFKDFTYSPDGSKMALIYSSDESGEIDDNVLDGNKEWTSLFGSCEYPVYSPDGSKLAVVNIKRHIYVNDEPIETSELADKIISAPVFSPDSQKISYVVKHKTKNGEFLAENNSIRSSVGFKKIISESIVYSPDSKNIAFVDQGKIEKFNIIVINDRILDGNWESIEHLTFSPDNTKIMFVGLKGKKYYRVVRDVSEFLN